MKPFKAILHFVLAIFVLLSSVGVKAHTMYCHDTPHSSLFVAPESCCSEKLQETDESGIYAAGCCRFISEHISYDYESPVPGLQFLDFVPDFIAVLPSYIYVPQFVALQYIPEEQNLPPPLYAHIERSKLQVYLI